MADAQDPLSGSLQENTLTLLCVSDEYCQLVRHAVPVELFSTFLYRDIIQRVYTFIDQHKKAPGAHLPDLVEDLLDDPKRGEPVKQLLHNIAELAEGLNAQYVVTQLERFTRQQRLKLAVIEASAAIQVGDLDKAEAAWEKGTRERLRMFDAGVGLDEVMKDLKRHEDEAERILLGIPDLDIAGYGPGRKELHTFLAPPKAGKTWWLLYLAKRALLQRWRVLYITLEYEDLKLGRRFLQSLYSMTKRQIDDLRLPGFSLDDLERLIGFTMSEAKRPILTDPKSLRDITRKLAKFRARKNLIIKQFPTGALTVNALRAYLDNLELSQNFAPDLIIVDYPMLMQIDAANYRISLSNIFKDMRGIGVARNAAVAIVHQVNREGAGSKIIDGRSAAEDWSITAISDALLTYNRTTTEKELGLARLFLALGRDDRDQFSVLITQSYEIGQFVLDSRHLDYDYWVTLEKQGAKNAGSGPTTS